VLPQVHKTFVRSENNPHIAEPVGEVRPIVFKLFFLSEHIEVEVGISHLIYKICMYI
jgi:hypothetical protein